MTTFFSYLLVAIALALLAAQMSDGFATLFGSFLEWLLELVGINAKAGEPNPHGGGIEALKGATVECIRDFVRSESDGIIWGKVTFRGEPWDAIIYTGSNDYPKCGDKLLVEDVQGLKLLVTVPKDN